MRRTRPAAAPTRKSASPLGSLARRREGEHATVKEAATAVGLESKGFKRNVLGGKDRVRTTHGLIVHESKAGKTGNLLRLIQRPDAFEAVAEDD
jgi:hypothetical protein